MPYILNVPYADKYQAKALVVFWAAAAKKAVIRGAHGGPQFENVNFSAFI